MAHDASKVLNFKCGNLDIKGLDEIRKFARELVSETEELISQVIPVKILALDKLCKSELFNKEKSTSYEVDIHIPRNGLQSHTNSSESSTVIADGDVKSVGKKRKFEETEDKECQESVPINNFLTPMIQAIKPEVKELIQTCSKVQLWIQLLIPKIEDGNNFGVSIQEEILNEVNRIQTEATSFLDQISRYYITRGKLLSKVAKYPLLDDYRQVIKEVDAKEYVSLQQNSHELRNFYLLLLDSISKNYEKIKKPRSSNVESMY
ncbi:proteasome activator complex subunit 3-like [Rhopilema esculentum]|uniref:proteasome activator complex subunit 3-like n=1 Tax=Rhopilema esculentum TaxID=499914 RepID=UPI0031D2C310|eukprot:gene14377-5426_t